MQISSDLIFEMRVNQSVEDLVQPYKASVEVRVRYLSLQILRSLRILYFSTVMRDPLMYVVSESILPL